MENAYDKEVHDDYFSHFSWHRLLDRELALFPPLVVVTDHEQAMANIDGLTRLLASNQPIKVIVMRSGLTEGQSEGMAWEDAANQFRRELGALAISQRNVFTFQVTMESPQLIYRRLDETLHIPSPVLGQILMPDTKPNYSREDVFKLGAACAGRYFPSFYFNPLTMNFQFDQNSQPEKIWPSYEFEINDGNDRPVNIDFTYADYKALFPSKMKELMMVPASFVNTDLIAINEYLKLDEDQLYGKIPFIWLKDENNNIQRAALSNLWVVSCQERMAYWRFLQQLAGMYQPESELSVEQPIEESSAAEDPRSASHSSDAVSEKAIRIAAERMIRGLLGKDAKYMRVPPAAPSINKVSSIEEQAVIKPEVDQKEPITKAWVETAVCTSCNDCIDQFPNLFGYNEEKQAYLKDASKGTYEQLVKAAEKCPAACIHPGLPLNSEEPNLEKLIKRAEKFNKA